MKARIFNNDTNQYEEVETEFRVVINGRKKHFATQELAAKFANEYFDKHGIVLGIEQVPARVKNVKVK
jgi:hypothetical protein